MSEEKTIDVVAELRWLAGWPDVSGDASVFVTCGLAADEIQMLRREVAELKRVYDEEMGWDDKRRGEGGMMG